MIFWSAKKWHRHFFSTLHPLSTVIFATATVLAFVLLHDSRFNFHWVWLHAVYNAQHETTSTQKSAQKCAVTSPDFLRERLQSAFTLANQLGVGGIKVCMIAKLCQSKREFLHNIFWVSLCHYMTFRVYKCVSICAYMWSCVYEIQIRRN